MAAPVSTVPLTGTVGQIKVKSKKSGLSSYNNFLKFFRISNLSKVTSQMGTTMNTEI